MFVTGRVYKPLVYFFNRCSTSRSQYFGLFSVNGLISQFHHVPALGVIFTFLIWYLSHPQRTGNNYTVACMITFHPGHAISAWRLHDHIPSSPRYKAISAWRLHDHIPSSPRYKAISAWRFHRNLSCLWIIVCARRVGVVYNRHLVIASAGMSTHITRVMIASAGMCTHITSAMIASVGMCTHITNMMIASVGMYTHTSLVWCVEYRKLRNKWK